MVTASERWQAWLNGWVKQAGSMSALAFRIPVQVSTVGRWRDCQSFPEADLQARLAEITGDPIMVIRDLVWNAEKERAEAKRRQLLPLAPEVEPARSFRPPQAAGGRASRRPQAGGGRRPIRNGRVKKALGVALLATGLGVLPVASQAEDRNYAEMKTSSVKRRKLAA